MTHSLHTHPLFQVRTELLSYDESIALSYKRARLFFKTYGERASLPTSISRLAELDAGLTVRDIQNCSPRFWKMFRDPLFTMDISMFTIVVVQASLVIGTLSRHLKNRPDLKTLVDRLMRFETIGVYLLTERGHGLDAFNAETTAIKTPHGFILNSPREEAAKLVPWSSY